MEKVYRLEHLSCPHCAAALEKKLGGVGGVTSARVDLITQRLTVEHEESIPPERLEQTVRELVAGVEPGATVRSSEPEEASGPEEGGEAPERAPSADLFRMLGSAAVFGLAFLAGALGARVAADILFGASLLLSGGEVFWRAVRNIGHGELFDENLLMSIACIAAFAIGQYPEGAAVMLFGQVGEYAQELATRRSRRSIADLMGLRPDVANLKTPQGVRRVKPQEVAPGSLIEIRPGERVPLDGTVTEGSSLLDTSALTGEPVPRRAGPGSGILSGFVNGGGLLTVRVEKAYGDSAVARIIRLVEESGSKKARAEAFITRFARVYTPAVCAAALLLALLPPLLLAQPFSPWLYRAVVFLVVSCPCALVVSVPLGFFAGIGAASRHGVLVKGGNYLELLAGLDTVVFDKTGTLTQGVFEVAALAPAPGVSERELLRTAAEAEAAAVHPAALAIRRAWGQPPEHAPEAYEEIAGMGAAAQINGERLLAGNERLLAREGIACPPCGLSGTLVLVARGGKYLGCISISDRLRGDAAAAVEGLRRLGVRRTAMLTGDNERAARDAAEAVGIDEFSAGLLPDGKVEAYEKLAAGAGGTGACAFVGDGINDAPVLARADVGIAMGGMGSDAAVEAADVVLMDDKPSRLLEAVRVARRVRLLVRENIVFALSVKFLVLALGALGWANIWAAVFADTGVTLLAVLNSMRALLPRRAKAAQG